MFEQYDPDRHDISDETISFYEVQSVERGDGAVAVVLVPVDGSSVDVNVPWYYVVSDEEIIE